VHTGLLFTESDTGQLPRNWISEKVPIDNEIFVKSVENALLDLVATKENRENESYRDVPMSVKTVNKHAEKYLASKFMVSKRLYQMLPIPT
jgi:hypothetical protein